MSEHVMLDLETLGTTPGCIVVSIGACTFDCDGVEDIFYKIIDICRSPGLDAAPSTIAWWMEQSAEARAVFTDPNRVPLDLALTEFKEWFIERGGRFVWAHGASFDGPILEAAYKARHMQPPWKFYDLRDTRTLYHLSGIYPERDSGTHHNARDDAVAQARAATLSLNKLGWPTD